ncbi:MAG: KUP/HAK/KT family potassium transporter [Candidatus Symbiobacter sp.]|nr:KUP/HAK/KT family potassium transporter [Candidatus Symbiobacter sp.]
MSQISAAQDGLPGTGKASRERAVKPALVLMALGIVFGDIGTSPLYGFKAGLAVAGGVTEANVLGLLSLVFWTLTLVVSLFYVQFVMRADNEGEGGILALGGLVTRGNKLMFLLPVAMFGSTMLYADGMITPAISVLSAFEGLRTATPTLSHYIVPLTVVVLLAFFAVQHRGTARIGKLFGPLMLLWFVVLFALGLRGVLASPYVLVAINPIYAIHFVGENFGTALLVMGAVFLTVTGGEALYADMGHMGRRPIMQAWYFVANPALLMNYFGQGAMVLSDPTAVENPFYSLCPPSLVIPMVVLAAVATVIASQSVVSGVFSLTKQAIALGRIVPLRVVQTSSSEYGQIYIPVVNWMVAIGTLLLVILFRSSENLAGAYGLAVSSTMLITACMFTVVLLQKPHWPIAKALAFIVVFVVMEIMFVAANMSKLFEGGWVPILLGLTLFLLTVTWTRGTRACSNKIRQMSEDYHQFIARLDEPDIRRLPGTAVFLTRMRDKAPPLLSNLVRWNRSLHETVILLSIEVLRVPRVHARDRMRIEPLGQGITRVVATYGYMQTPDVHVILRWLPRLAGLEVDPGESLFYLWSEEIYRDPEKSVMPQFLLTLFTFMRRNGARAPDYFHLPQDRVIEIGVHLEI